MTKSLDFDSLRIGTFSRVSRRSINHHGFIPFLTERDSIGRLITENSDGTPNDNIFKEEKQNKHLINQDMFHQKFKIRDVFNIDHMA